MKIWPVLWVLCLFVVSCFSAPPKEKYTKEGLSSQSLCVRLATLCCPAFFSENTLRENGSAKVPGQKKEFNEFHLFRHFSKLPESQQCRWEDLSVVSERTQNLLAGCTRQDLAVFDIDDLLLEAVDPSFQSRYVYSEHEEFARVRERYRSFLEKEFCSSNYPYNIADRMKYQQRRLVEPCIATIISRLQEKGVPVIALSAFSAGPVGNVDSLQELRYQELKQAGIDFNKGSWICAKDFLDQLKFDRFKNEPKGAVTFYKNILCSSRQEKGLILNRYIALMDENPQRVYFFDDNFYNHQSVGVALNYNKIPLTSIWYTGAKKLLPCSEIDLEVAEKQFDTMHETVSYSSYHYAKALVEQDRELVSEPAILKKSANCFTKKKREESSRCSRGGDQERLLSLIAQSNS